MIVSKLISLANMLDARGLLSEADYVDRLIKDRLIKIASDNVIKFPGAYSTSVIDSDASLFDERGTFKDYDETLSELAATMQFVSDMPLTQRDWDGFVKDTILEQISGFDSSVPPAPLMDASQVPEDDLSEVTEEGGHTDYAFGVETSLRLLQELADENSELGRMLAAMPESKRFSVIKFLMQEQLEKIDSLLKETNLSEDPGETVDDNIFSFPPQEGKQDPNSLDEQMFLELGKESGSSVLGEEEAEALIQDYIRSDWSASRMEESD